MLHGQALAEAQDSAIVRASTETAARDSRKVSERFLEFFRKRFVRLAPDIGCGKLGQVVPVRACSL